MLCRANMDQETYSRIENNDPTLTELWIDSFPGNLYLSHDRNIDLCRPINSDDLARLGRAIGKNTHLVRVCFGQGIGGNHELGDTKPLFYDGVRMNESIKKLRLSRCNLSEGAGYDLLKAFGENGTNLIEISLVRCGLSNRGFQALTTALTKCTGLRKILLHMSNIDDELLQRVIDAIGGNHKLEMLDLSSNNIGSEGCRALARLLQDPDSSLRVLALDRNVIDDTGSFVLANALRNNTTLEELQLDQNRGITSVGLNEFYQVVCNTSSILDTFLSNHTLERLEEFESEDWAPSNIRRELDRNCSNDKHGVAIKKILCHHQHLNVESFFEWDLKVLPYAIEWFRRARLCCEDIANLDAKILSSIYQFALAMPMQFVPFAQRAQSKRKLQEADK